MVCGSNAKGPTATGVTKVLAYGFWPLSSAAAAFCSEWNTSNSTEPHCHTTAVMATTTATPADTAAHAIQRGRERTTTSVQATSAKASGISAGALPLYRVIAAAPTTANAHTSIGV